MEGPGRALVVVQFRWWLGVCIYSYVLLGTHFE